MYRGSRWLVGRSSSAEVRDTGYGEDVHGVEGGDAEAGSEVSGLGGRAGDDSLVSVRTDDEGKTISSET